MKPALAVLIVLPTLSLSAQDNEADTLFMQKGPVSLDFGQEEEPIPAGKKKKPKKKVFYGIKTKKGFTRKGYGENITYELFYYLKKSEQPKTFVRDIWWYDFARRELRRTSRFDPAKGVLLHGPYKKMMGDVVLEEGIFYKGTKHGRWMRYDKDQILQDKEKYFRGWPKETQAVYYDLDRKNIREITPIEFGEKEGYYYQFFESGTIAVTGEYHWDQRIGDWIENYPNGRRKRIISYPKEAYDRSFIPYVRREWDAKGKEIYNNSKARQ